MASQNIRRLWRTTIYAQGHQWKRQIYKVTHFSTKQEIKNTLNNYLFPNSSGTFLKEVPIPPKMENKKQKKCHLIEILLYKLICSNNKSNSSHFPPACLPGYFAHIPAFGVEFLAETGAEEKTNQRKKSKRVLYFHCTSSIILLDAVFTPHYPHPKVTTAGFQCSLHTPVSLMHIKRMRIPFK